MSASSDRQHRSGSRSGAVRLLLLASALCVSAVVLALASGGSESGDGGPRSSHAPPVVPVMERGDARVSAAERPRAAAELPTREMSTLAVPRRESSPRVVSARSERPEDASELDESSSSLPRSVLVTGRLLGPRETPLAGGEVRFAAESLAVTDQGGRFACRVPHDCRQLTASAPGHARTTRPLSLAGAEGVFDFGDLQLRAGVALRGSVTELGSGAPLRAVTLRLRQVGSSRFGPAVRTSAPEWVCRSDDLGGFHFDGLPATGGRFLLRAALAGREPLQREIALDAGMPPMLGLQMAALTAR